MRAAPAFPLLLQCPELRRLLQQCRWHFAPHAAVSRAQGLLLSEGRTALGGVGWAERLFLSLPAGTACGEPRGLGVGGLTPRAVGAHRARSIPECFGMEGALRATRLQPACCSGDIGAAHWVCWADCPPAGSSPR